MPIQNSNHRKMGLVLTAIILLAIGVFQIFTLRQGHDWGDDFAQYLLHARNIATGQPYANTGYIVNPANPSIGPAAYPPFFPLTLAPIYALTGLNLMAFKILEIILLLLSLTAFMLLIIPKLGRASTLVLLIVLGFNPYLTEFKNLILSEYLCLFFTFGALVAFQRFQTAERTPAWQWTGIGFLAFLAIGTRSAAIVLLPSFIFSEWTQKHHIPWRALGVTGIAIGFSLIQGWLVPGTSSYLTILNFDPPLMAVLTQEYLKLLVQFWGFSPDSPGGLVFMVFTLVVLAYRLLYHRTVTAFFFIAYAVLIVVWGNYQGMRFIFPLAFFAGYYWFDGINLILRKLKAAPPLKIGVILLVGISMLTAFLPGILEIKTNPFPYGPETPGAQKLFATVVQQTQPNDKLLFFKPRAMALYTGRASMGFSKFTSDQALWAQLSQFEITYLAAERVASEYARNGQGYYIDEFVKRFPGNFENLYENQEFALYRVIKFP